MVAPWLIVLLIPVPARSTVIGSWTSMASQPYALKEPMTVDLAVTLGCVGAGGREVIRRDIKCVIRK
jgi:hypothetical protein